jgi:hypothetical protein
MQVATCTRTKNAIVLHAEPAKPAARAATLVTSSPVVGVSCRVGRVADEPHGLTVVQALATLWLLQAAI